MRVKSTVPAAVLALLVFGFSACGGYYRLSKELVGYQGTPYYRDQLESAVVAVDESGDAGRTAAEPAVHEFAAVVESLKERRARWERALAPGADESFYLPDAGLLERMAPAAEDAEKASAVVNSGAMPAST